MTSSKIRWSPANPWTNNFYTTKVHRDRAETLQLKSHIIFCSLWCCKIKTFFILSKSWRVPFHTRCVINRSEKLLQIVTCVQNWMESRTSKALDCIVGATKILSSVNVWKPVSINFSRFCPIITIRVAACGRIMEMALVLPPHPWSRTCIRHCDPSLFLFNHANSPPALG